MTDPHGAIRRAPRLAPDERIAPYVTRLGRFRALDPSVGRPLPALPRILAATAWAVLLGETLRRAVARDRAGGT